MWRRHANQATCTGNDVKAKIILDISPFRLHAVWLFFGSQVNLCQERMRKFSFKLNLGHLVEVWFQSTQPRSVYQQGKL